MAMDMGGAKGGVKSDINVTPLVDVMLVLLIIMMLVAPMLQQGVSLQLPKANNTTDKVEWHGGGCAARTGSVPRRTFTDITAHPAFGHAPDYSWLVGSLDYIKSRQAWCLRYASVDEDDRYGGTVTLVDPGPMTGYRSGQLVRVKGEMVDRPVPGYRVRALTPLQQP